MGGMKMSTSSNLHENPAEKCANNRDFSVFLRISAHCTFLRKICMFLILCKFGHVFAQFLHVVTRIARKLTTFAQKRAKLARDLQNT